MSDGNPNEWKNWPAEHDPFRAETNAAAAALAAWLSEQMAAGGNPNALGYAMIGFGADMLWKAQGMPGAIQALRCTEQIVRDMDAAPPSSDAVN